MEPPRLRQEAHPTKQEELLLNLNCRAYDAAAHQILQDLAGGRSPSILSVARADILVAVSSELQKHVASRNDAPEPSYKHKYFDEILQKAKEGDPEAVVALPKFVTSLGELATTTTLILDNRNEITKWRQQHQQYLQYLGTFDPQHIGHRMAIQSSVSAAEDTMNCTVQVMSQHPLKEELHKSYDDRYEESEERLYASPLIDNLRVTQVDLPGGTELAQTYPGQMKLLADVSGDTEYRWMIGSDKFMSDAAAVRDATSSVKALQRFSDPKLHAYVIRRKSDDVAELARDVDFIADRFGLKVTLIEEQPYDCAPASSTKVNQLRAEGHFAEADHMELYELNDE